MISYVKNHLNDLTKMYPTEFGSITLYVDDARTLDRACSLLAGLLKRLNYMWLPRKEVFGTIARLSGAEIGVKVATHSQYHTHAFIAYPDGSVPPVEEPAMPKRSKVRYAISVVGLDYSFTSSEFLYGKRSYYDSPPRNNISWPVGSDHSEVYLSYVRSLIPWPSTGEIRRWGIYCRIYNSPFDDAEAAQYLCSGCVEFARQNKFHQNVINPVLTHSGIFIDHCSQYHSVFGRAEFRRMLGMCIDGILCHNDEILRDEEAMAILTRLNISVRVCPPL